MMTLLQNPQIEWRDAVREVKRALPIRQVFRIVGWRVRSRGRADCGLCKGSSQGTVAFDDRLWRCHRCAAGGDALSLIMAAHISDFITALKFLASEARVELPVKVTAEERRRLAEQQAEHRRIGNAAVKLETAERGLRLWYCAAIHRSEQKQAEVRQRLGELHGGAAERWGGEYEGCWGWLAALVPLLREYLAGYSLLSFGSACDHARFVLRPALRQQMINDALLAGFVDDHGRRQEVFV